ncbi:leucine-rich repeat and IQ domain-containing protein 1 isoform X2 [Synchiropus splendidus]|uniref:leucine-rich repeat and IQ domain-containing protein 1 isoform X2 n=1 Tax=Synchiropus splendidus TaxID=270530 RepID=UPI00237DCB9D|nr:leucine-rich repeat and IQ domain-containing protein 1 isoform X2 [Synchiropus splendidus]
MQASDLNQTMMPELNGLTGTEDIDGHKSFVFLDTESTDGIPISFLNYFERSKNRAALYEELFSKDLYGDVSPCPEKHLDPCDILVTKEESEEGAEFKEHREQCCNWEMEELRRLREEEFQMELRRLIEYEKCQQTALELEEKMAQEKLEEELLLQQELMSKLRKQVEEEIQKVEENKKWVLQQKQRREEERKLKEADQRCHREVEETLHKEDGDENREGEKLKKKEEMLRNKEDGKYADKRMFKEGQEDTKQKENQETEDKMREEEQRKNLDENEERQMLVDKTTGRGEKERKQLEDERRMKQQEGWKKMELEQKRSEQESKELEVEDDRRVRDIKERIKVESKISEEEELTMEDADKKVQQVKKKEVDTKKAGKDQIRELSEKQEIEVWRLKKEDHRNPREVEEKREEEGVKQTGERYELKKNEEMLRQEDEIKKEHMDSRRMSEERNKTDEMEKKQPEDQRFLEEERVRKKKQDNENKMREEEQRKITGERVKRQLIEDERIRREERERKKMTGGRRMKQQEELNPKRRDEESMTELENKKVEDERRIWNTIERIKEQNENKILEKKEQMRQFRRQVPKLDKKGGESQTSVLEEKQIEGEERNLRKEDQRGHNQEEERQLVEDERQSWVRDELKTEVLKREEERKKKHIDEKKLREEKQRKENDEIEYMEKVDQREEREKKKREKDNEKRINEEELTIEDKRTGKEEAERKKPEEERRMKQQEEKKLEEMEPGRKKGMCLELDCEKVEDERRMEDFKEQILEENENKMSEGSEWEEAEKKEGNDGIAMVNQDQRNKTKEDLTSHVHLSTREVCEKKQETENGGRTIEIFHIKKEKNVVEDRDDLEMKCKIRDEVKEKEEKKDEGENDMSDHSQVGLIQEREKRAGGSMSVIEVNRQVEKQEEKDIKEDEIEFVKENDVVKDKSRKQTRVEGMRKAIEGQSRCEEMKQKLENATAEQNKCWIDKKVVKERHLSQQATNKRTSTTVDITDVDASDEKNKNDSLMKKNVQPSEERTEEVMQQEGGTSNNINGTERRSKSDNSLNEKTLERMRDGKKSTTLERDGGTQLWRKRIVLEGESQSLTAVPPERESEGVRDQLSSWRISPSSGVNAQQEGMCTDLGLALPEHTAQKRLSWMKECVSWSKLSVQNRRKQRGSSKKERRWPRAGVTLPPLCPDNLLQLSGFKSLQEVTVVSLESLPACSLLTLSQCPQLQSLTIRRCQLNSLEGLNQLSELCVIDAQENDISYLDCRDMTGLKVLRLNHNKLTSIHGLSGVEHLMVLELAHNSITRVAGLESMKRLQILTLDHNQLISTRGLRDVYTLQHLSCSHNHLARVEGLENCALLSKLDLTANSLTEPPSLHNHVLLTELRLDDNSISSLQSLCDCWLPMLQVLAVAQNRITHLPSMSDFLSLAYLDLRFNCLSEVKKACDSLTGCQLLREVHLEGNPLEQESSWRCKLNAAFSGLMATDDRKTDASLYPTSEQWLASASGSFFWFCQALLRQTRELRHQHIQELGDSLPAQRAAEVISRHLTAAQQLAEDQRFAHEYGDLTFTAKNKAMVQRTSDKTLEKNTACTGQLMMESGVDLPGGAPPEYLRKGNIPSNQSEDPSQVRQYDGLDLLSTKEGKTSTPLKTAPKHQYKDVKNEVAAMSQQMCGQYSQSDKCSEAQNGGDGEKTDLIILHKVQDHAAVVIQACWRGFSLRRRLASALAAVKGTDPGEEDTFELLDVNQFVFDETTLDHDWTLTLPEDLPMKCYHVSEQASAQKLAPLTEASQRVLPSPPMTGPKQAWGTEENAESSKSLNRSKSPSSKSVTSLSERSEKIVEEWGFTNSTTALLMLKRARRMKSERPQKKKDPSVNLGTFGKRTLQLGPVVARNMPVPQNKNCPRECQDKFDLQHAEKEMKRERALEWLQTQDNDHFLPELSLDILNGGKVQLTAEPGYTEQVHLSSGPSFRSPSKHWLHKQNITLQSTFSNQRRETPPLHRVVAAPLKKERLTFRDNPVQMSVGWGSGKKTHRLHK